MHRTFINILITTLSKLWRRIFSRERDDRTDEHTRREHDRTEHKHPLVLFDGYYNEYNRERRGGFDDDNNNNNNNNNTRAPAQHCLCMYPPPPRQTDAVAPPPSPPTAAASLLHSHRHRANGDAAVGFRATIPSNDRQKNGGQVVGWG